MAEETGGATEALEIMEASEREATEEPEGPKAKIFVVPIEDGEDIQLVLPRRWKRGKFLKEMRKGDIWGALESIWPPSEVIDEETGEPVIDPATDEPELEEHPELAKLSDAEMDEDEFRLLLERMGETLMGRKPPKGKASRR